MVFHYTGSIVSWITLGTGGVFIALLRATAPGFGEEIMFRGLGIANYMRNLLLFFASILCVLPLNGQERIQIIFNLILLTSKESPML